MPHAILIEAKTSGQQLTQELKANSDLPIIEIIPHNDKLTRFYQIVPVIESGRVVLPQQAIWLNDFEYEILMFPETRHDDQVDSTVQYLQWMRKINTSAFRVRDFGPNPNKTLRWLRAVKLISLTLTYLMRGITQT